LVEEQRLQENIVDDEPCKYSTSSQLIRVEGLKDLRLHDLRHSYASLMLEAEVNMKTISQSMGHANIGITLDTYSHLRPGMGRTATERFDKLLRLWLDEKMSAKDDDLDTRLEGFEPTTLGSEVWGTDSQTVVLRSN